MTDQDTELMLQAARGDQDAFAKLFELYYARALNIAYRFLGNQEIAEDIAMDAFVRIYEARNKFRGGAKFSTYLYRVVINLCLNAVKHKRIAREQLLDESVHFLSNSVDPSASAEQNEKIRVVRNAILELPHNQRLAVILTRYQGLSYHDAAYAMGVSVKALESLLHRAKLKLRETLSAYL
ncbi:MAG: RNA polymerase sigma factor [Armatimonadota bacterium]